MTTLRELITGSLRLINVVQANETPTADDITIGKSAFDAMVDSWSTDKANIFTSNPYYFVTNAGQKDYTLGDGGDWDIARPMEVSMAYASLNATTGPYPYSYTLAWDNSLGTKTNTVISNSTVDWGHFNILELPITSGQALSPNVIDATVTSISTAVPSGTSYIEPWTRSLYLTTSGSAAAALTFTAITTPYGAGFNCGPVTYAGASTISKTIPAQIAKSITFKFNMTALNPDDAAFVFVSTSSNYIIAFTPSREGFYDPSRRPWMFINGGTEIKQLLPATPVLNRWYQVDVYFNTGAGNSYATIKDLTTNVTTTTAFTGNYTPLSSTIVRFNQDAAITSSPVQYTNLEIRNFVTPPALSASYYYPTLGAPALFNPQLRYTGTSTAILSNNGGFYTTGSDYGFTWPMYTTINMTVDGMLAAGTLRATFTPPSPGISNSTTTVSFTRLDTPGDRLPGILINTDSAIDLPMEKLTMDEYSAIGTKNITMKYPMKWYDNGDYPLRTISIWPVPSERGVIQLWLWQPLTTDITIDDNIVFPTGYERALRFALAVELASEFGKEIPVNVARIAKMSKSVIKRLNSKPKFLKGDMSIASNETALFNYVTGDTIPTNM